MKNLRLYLSSMTTHFIFFGVLSSGLVSLSSCDFRFSSGIPLTTLWLVWLTDRFSFSWSWSWIFSVFTFSSPSLSSAECSSSIFLLTQLFEHRQSSLQNSPSRLQPHRLVEQVVVQLQCECALVSEDLAAPEERSGASGPSVTRFLPVVTFFRTDSRTLVDCKKN